MKKLFFVAGAILTAVLVTTVPARAKTVECVGTFTGVIDANVVVPPGQICILLSAEVNGWVTVGENADLGFFFSTSKGDIRGERGLGISIHNSTVQGNVVMKNGVDLSVLLSTIDGNVNAEDYGGTEIRVGQSVIGGNLQIKNSANNSYGIGSNTVGQNIHFYQNVSLVPAQITGNTIGGNLHCQDNTPPPAHAANTVGGHTQGQCDEGS